MIFKYFKTLSLFILALATLFYFAVRRFILYFSLWTTRKHKLNRPKSNGRIAVCIPTLNVGSRLLKVLQQVFSANEDDIDVFVADGGSTDETLSILKRFDVTVVKCPVGRANGLNAAAAAALKHSNADLMVFLHGDTVLPDNWDTRIRDSLDDHPTRAVGYFWFKMEPMSGIENYVASFIEWLTWLRAVMTETAVTGDMSFHMHRETYVRLGGFSAIPLMEDCDFIYRAQRYYDIISSGPGAPTDCRRWRGKGIHCWDNSGWNYFFYLMWHIGFYSSEDVHRNYYVGRPLPKSYPLGSNKLQEKTIQKSSKLQNNGNPRSKKIFA